MVGIVKQTKCMIKYIGCRIGKEYEILNTVPWSELLRTTRQKGNKNFPFYGRQIIHVPGLQAGDTRQD